MFLLLVVLFAWERVSMLYCSMIGTFFISTISPSGLSCLALVGIGGVGGDAAGLASVFCTGRAWGENGAF